MSAPRISILNGRVVDPGSRLDAELGVHLADGRVLAIGPAPAGFEPDRIIDARDKIVCPGFVDLSARCREPGHEQKATIASETRAAAGAGITCLCCPPDTLPIIDTPAVAKLVQQIAAQSGYARLLPIGAMTLGLEGRAITEMAALREAGCPALSQADQPIRSVQITRRALEYAATFGLKVFVLPQDSELSEGGCAHEGVVSSRLGLPGIPTAAETVAVGRYLALAEETGARVHFRGLSTARGVAMLAEARGRGVPVSGDVSMHQLFLTEHDLKCFDANCHLIPPLRTIADRDALRDAVAAGEISAICSDHQPHDPDAKLAPFPETAPGVSALETLLPLALRLVREGVLDLATAIERLTLGPARVLDLELGELKPGFPADVCVLDPNAGWTLDARAILSQGQNTPFLGQEMLGRVGWTLLGGQVVFERRD